MIIALKRAALSVLVIAGLAGCQIGQPNQMALAFSAYTNRPVVLTEMSVNGSEMAFTPLVIRGRADTNRPQEGAGRRLLGYPGGENGIMDLDVTWVELPSGAAYSARVDVPLSNLNAAASGGVEFMPIFAPNGLLIVTSDPVPTSASDRTVRDIIRICATRTPAGDKNYRANPSELAALREALAAATTIGPGTCNAG